MIDTARHFLSIPIIKKNLVSEWCLSYIIPFVTVQALFFFPQLGPATADVP